MTIQAGTRLGPYEVLAHVGAGGMGEVWRAQDTRLAREVAIKVLPAGLARNPQFRARFEREAKVISQLSHPHVCTLFDVGQEGDLHFLVMEMLEGESLLDRLKKGPLPVDQVLKVGQQIALALDAAHRHAIVHRDLKPGNVMLTKSGAKLLDFGLARAAREGPAALDGLSALPTEAKPLTIEGTILGTFQYMSPEQLEGPGSGRADGHLRSGRLALRDGDGPAGVRGNFQDQPDRGHRVIAAGADHECRGRGAAGARPRGGQVPGEGQGRPLAVGPRRGERACVDQPGRVTGGSREPCAPTEPSPPSDRVGDARDGHPHRSRGLPVVRRAGDPVTACAAVRHRIREHGRQPGHALSRRNEHRLHQGRRHPNARSPPAGASRDPRDRGRSRSLLVAGRRMARVHRQREALEDPPRRKREDPSEFRGSRTGLRQGGMASGRKNRLRHRLLAALRSAGSRWRSTGDPRAQRQRGGLSRPEHASRREGFLFVIHEGDRFDSITLWNGKERKTILRLPGMSLDRPVYATSGHVLFARSPQGRGVWALPFSLDRLEPTGGAFPVAPFGANPSVAGSTLVYTPLVPPILSEIVELDRKGQVVRRIGTPRRGLYPQPALSPDGRLLVVPVLELSGSDLWMYDVASGEPARLTFHGSSQSSAPVWAPDGSEIVYTWSSTSEDISLRAVKVNRSATRELGPGAGPIAFVGGNEVLYNLHAKGFDFNLWRKDLGDRGSGDPLLTDPGNEMNPALSPDGRFLAYDKAGDVLVRTFPGLGGPWQVATGGASKPVWSRDGGRLFFLSGSDMMGVSLERTAGLRVGIPKRLFTFPQAPGGIEPGGSPGAGFVLGASGETFIMVRPIERPPGIVVVQDWLALVER